MQQYGVLFASVPLPRVQRPGPLHTLRLSIVNHPLGQSPVFNLL